ncbi:hypothetical protein TNCV_4871511 [Trichonephila clavipes]|nr:hypothetical protein TNCV_4871511 [Trichonephila clavipes]
MPLNALRGHTEYMLVKSVGPKVLCAESREYFSSVPFLNCGGGNRRCRHLSFLWEFLRVKSFCHLDGAQD